MISKEMKSRIEEAEVMLAERFESITIGTRRCFRLSNGRIISVGCMGAYNALVIEYAESEAEAKLNRFEDGDLFFLDEMDSETMHRNMIQEILQ